MSLADQRGENSVAPLLIVTLRLSTSVSGTEVLLLWPCVPKAELARFCKEKTTLAMHQYVVIKTLLAN